MKDTTQSARKYDHIKDDDSKFKHKRKWKLNGCQMRTSTSQLAGCENIEMHSMTVDETVGYTTI